MHDVFISYSSKDKSIADAVCHTLEGDDIPCWIVPRDVQPGTPYAREIIKGIKECKVLVLIFTSNSNISEHVCNEIDKAFNYKKTIIPFIVEDIPMDEALEYYLSRKHWLAAHPSYEEHLEELAIAVEKVIGRELRTKMSAKNAEYNNETEPVRNTITLKILSNADCKVKLDCEEKGTAKAGTMLKIKLLPGEYYAEFITLEDKKETICDEIFIEHDKLYRVNFSSPQQEDKTVVERSTLIPCIQNGKFGFADEITGNLIIPCIYDEAYTFRCNIARVRLNNKWGYIDPSGKNITPLKYDDANSIVEELAMVRSKEGWGYINQNGKEIIPCRYDYSDFFNEGLAKVKFNKKLGFIDHTGKDIIPCIYDYADSFSEGIATVRSNGMYGFIDKFGNCTLD